MWFNVQEFSDLKGVVISLNPLPILLIVGVLILGGVTALALEDALRLPQSKLDPIYATMGLFVAFLIVSFMVVPIMVLKTNDANGWYTPTGNMDAIEATWKRCRVVEKQSVEQCKDNIRSIQVAHDQQKEEGTYGR